MPKFRVSYLMAPASVREAVYVRPSDPAAKAYYDASFGMGKSAAQFSLDVSRALALGLYERVVSLDAPDMEAVFGMCNSKDCYWGDDLPDSANAVFLKKGGLRSMSVGDLIDDGGGNYWVCASFGFEPLSLDAVPVAGSLSKAENEAYMASIGDGDDDPPPYPGFCGRY